MSYLFSILLVPDSENQVKSQCGGRIELHRLVMAWVLSKPYFLPLKQLANGVGQTFDNLANHQKGRKAKTPLVGWSQMISRYHQGLGGSTLSLQT